MIDRTEPRDLSAYLARIHADWLSSEPDASSCEIDGTLVFADVSGFTPLTERYATLGKVGAEELTITLNAIFGSVLDLATSYGGDLLKFGGDALFLLFTGDGHPARACAAAYRMQEALRPYRRFRTGTGSVSLKMSVGVASGRVQLVLAGASHRELLAVGPVVSAVAAMESAANADEILLAPETAAGMQPAALGSEKEGGVLLKKVPDVEAEPLRRAARSDGISAGIPAGLRDYLRTPREDGEHRIVAFSFVQFKGTDRLLATNGLPALARALDSLISVTQDACERDGVTFLATDLDRDGGKILLVAGAPSASTDDEDRLLHALLDIVRADVPLAVRAGVNRGRAFAVDVGSRERRTFTLMGDPINLAARVMGKAEPGTIVATKAVLEAARSEHALTPLEPFLVKGKSRPVEGAVVGEATGRRERASSLARFVGREAELDMLRSALAVAIQGRGRVIELVGEPGIGKSRLVAEFRASVQGIPVLWIEGAPYATHSPYFALRGPLRRLLGVGATAADEETADALQRTVALAAPDLGPHLPLLALPLGLELPDTPETAEIDPAFRAPKLREALTELLGRLLPGKALVMIEDAHWLDAASGELMQRVLTTVEDHGWLACVTRRDVEEGLHVGDLPGATSISLGPLGDAPARHLLRDALEAHPLPADAVTALLERSGGNPLFLQELLAAAQAGGDLVELPDTVEAVIATRIDTLPPEDRALLRRAAVLGGRLQVSWLAAMAPQSEGSLDAGIRRLEGFLASVPGGELHFRHALLREVAYEGLSFRLRRALHARAGQLIEEQSAGDLEERCELLSLHYSAARLAGPAWRFSRMAGDRARRWWAPADAAVFYARAVDAARRLDDCDPRELSGVLESLGDVSELVGRYDDADAAYRNARRLPGAAPERIADLLRKEGWLRERSKKYAEALRFYTRGLRVVEPQAAGGEAARARARLTLAYGVARLRQGRYRDALRILERAVAEAEALKDLHTVAHAYEMLDWARTDFGVRTGARYAERALEIFEQLGDLNRQASVHNNLGIDAYYEGDWDEALRRYERSRVLWLRVGNGVLVGTATNNVAEILSDQGRIAEAEELFREALIGWRAAGFPAGIGIALSNLGRAACRSGRFDEAAALLARALEKFREIGAEPLALEAEARQAERLVSSGAGAGALPPIEEVTAGAARLGGMPVLLAMLDRIAGYALAQAGDLEGGLARTTASVARAREAGADFELALSLEARRRIVAAGGNAAEDEDGGEILRRLGVRTTPAIPASPAEAEAVRRRGNTVTPGAPAST